MPISRRPQGREPQPERTAQTEPAAHDETYTPSHREPAPQFEEKTPQPAAAAPVHTEYAPAAAPVQAPVASYEPTPEVQPTQTEVAHEYDAEEEARLEILQRLSPEAQLNASRLLQRIADDESTEVLLNGPESILFKVNGQRHQDNISFEDIDTYHAVINALILHETDTKDRIGDGHSEHLISGQLTLPDYTESGQPPTIARVHVIAPPAVKAAVVTIAKKAKRQYTLDDIAARGSMTPGMAEFLKALGQGRATIVFSGLSGSGKTTMLEAISHHFDVNDRVIIAEDTPELRLPLQDTVPLLSSPPKPGQRIEDVVTLEWLVAQANRMRPDRIIVGEVRGGEMAEFLAAANSGADGSMTTVHASSPRQTIDRIVSLSLKAPSSKNEISVLRDIASTVQVIVQMALIDGRHVVSEISEVGNVVVKESGTVQLSPLFQFDRNTNQWVSGRISDQFSEFLGQRGVAVSQAWFPRR